MAAAKLWERDQQLKTASARVAAARDGSGGALFLLAEAGLGKSSLLDEICRQSGDLRIACARGDPMEASLAFGFLSQVVHDLGGEAERWTVMAGEAGGRAATLYGTLRWLEEVAEEPVLIALDDLQWADPDSLAVLGFLCRRLGRLPVAVVATLRPWPADAAELAWSLARRGDAVVARLLPLSEQAAAEMLAERTGEACPPDTARRAWRLSGGNPLLLGLAVGGAVAEGDVPGEAEDLPLSVAERSLVLARFAGLGADGTRWAQAAAALGVDFSPELACEVAGLEGEPAEMAADAVWRNGLVGTSTNRGAEFVHPLFRQMLYEDMSPLLRAHLHARAFDALTARRMDEVAAEHAIRANLAGDAEAIRVLTDTGRRALRAGAVATAVSRLQAAVGFAGAGAAGGLLSEVAEALLQAGRAAEAASTVQQGLERELSLPDRVAALTMLSRAHFSLGDFHRAAGALDAAAALAEVDCPEAVVLPLCRHADAVMMTAGPAAALPLAARARDLARKGDGSARALATAKWGMLALYCGDPAGIDAAESAGRGLLGASRSELALDVRAGGASVLVPFACAAMCVEHFDEADAAFRAGIEEADRVGNVNAACTLAVPYGRMLLRTGLPAGLAVADRLLGVADLVPLAEPFARTLRSYAFLELGDEERSVAEADRARGLASDFSIWLSLLWLDHVQGMRLLRHGRFEDASDVYAGLEERYEALGVREPCIVPFARHAVIAHVRARRVRDAERVVDWLDERADALPCAWPAAAAAAGRAELALRRNDHAAADKAYRVAVEHLDGGSMPLELAEVLIEQGNVLRRDGRPREGRESLRRAAALAESGGGVWLARRAGEELAAAGGRRRRRRGADELTPQEQRIARLAATGASDKDIASHLGVSVRTVRTHLEHVFAKLAVHSRRDLMAMGERLDAVIGRKG